VQLAHPIYAIPRLRIILSEDNSARGAICVKFIILIHASESDENDSRIANMPPSVEPGSRACEIGILSRRAGVKSIECSIKEHASSQTPLATNSGKAASIRG
jgi:hypothetical protein